MNNILKYYYILWVDAVWYIRRKEKDSNTIFFPLVYMAAPLFCNIFSLTFLLDFVGIKINLIGIGNYLLSLINIHHKHLGVILTCFLVCITNYFVIFKDNKIDFLMEKYPNSKGKIFIPYLLISIFGPILFITIALLLNRFY